MQVPASEMWRLTALSCDSSLWVLNDAQTKDVDSRSHFDILCVIVIRKHHHWENNIIPNDDETHWDWLITSHTRLVVINAPSVISLTDTAVTGYVPVFDRHSGSGQAPPRLSGGGGGKYLGTTWTLVGAHHDTTYGEATVQLFWVLYVQFNEDLSWA